jgi:hypothetical protein
MLAHLLEFQISGLHLANDEGPPHAEDLGNLLGRELSMHRDECHGVESLYLHTRTVLG